MIGVSSSGRAPNRMWSLFLPPMRVYAGLCGSMWTYVGGPMRAYVDLCGPMRAYVGLCGSMRAYAGLCGPMWAYMGGPMRAYAGLCGPMRAYAGLCGPMWTYVGCMQPSSIIIRANRVVSSTGQAPDCMWSLFLPPFPRQCKRYLTIVFRLPTGFGSRCKPGDVLPQAYSRWRPKAAPCTCSQKRCHRWVAAFGHVSLFSLRAFFEFEL